MTLNLILICVGLALTNVAWILLWRNATKEQALLRRKLVDAQQLSQLISLQAKAMRRKLDASEASRSVLEEQEVEIDRNLVGVHDENQISVIEAAEGLDDFVFPEEKL